MRLVLSFCNRFIQITQCQACIVLLAFVFLTGHLLINSNRFNVQTFSDNQQMGIVSPNQGDRQLKMLVSTSASVSQNEESTAVTKTTPRTTKDRNQGTTTESLANSTNSEFDKNKEFLAGNVYDDSELAAVSETWLHEQENKYRLRNQRIEKICQRVISHPVAANKTQPNPKSNSSDPDVFEEFPNFGHFALSAPFKSMGCFVNKVASSSLLSAFLLLNGFAPTFTSPHSLSGFVEPKTLQDFEFTNKTFFKFMFVRNPFDRLLSCYLDKMVESTHWSLRSYRERVAYQAKLIMKKKALARQKASATPARARRHLLSVQDAGDQNHLSETTMLKMITDRMAEEVKQVQFMIDNMTTTQKPTTTRQANKTEIRPTFEEFLEFILDTDLLGNGYESHWVPYWRFCTPCSIRYDVIGKLETGVEDFRYIWTKTDMKSKVPIPWANHRQNHTKIDERERRDRGYYASLPKELILRVYKRFRPDFELFDYSINEILLKAGHDPIDEQGWIETF